MRISSVFAAVVFGFHPAASLAAERPNVVFILVDDLGYTDLGCQGSGYYETPRIDRLAAEGMRFTNHHHAQNCQPTRAALMSGQYGARTGVYTVGGIDRFDWSNRPLRPVENVTNLPLDRVTVAQSLKSAGYSTAIFGKWHLGEKGAYHPGKRGFDEAIVSNGKHFDFTTDPQVEVPEGAYLADFLTDRAEDFIRRKRGGPFFLYLPHFGVHSPYQAKPDLIEHFKNKAPVGGHYDPVYAAMIASIDESVGRILDLLEEWKLAENTLVVFASDNGGVGGYAREGIKQGGDVTDNSPLRSGKGSQYEGGTRVPLIFRWPGVTKAGSTCAVPTIHVDLPATFLEVAQAPVPDQVRDGESLVALLKDPDAALSRTAIYQHMPGYLGAGRNSWRTTPVGAIQEGDWKLMEFFEDGRLELYDLGGDPGESKNLSSTRSDKAAELHTKLKAWREAIGAAMPAANEGSAAVPAKKKNGGKGTGTGEAKKG